MAVGRLVVEGDTFVEQRGPHLGRDMSTNRSLCSTSRIACSWALRLRARVGGVGSAPGPLKVAGLTRCRR